MLGDVDDAGFQDFGVLHFSAAPSYSRSGSRQRKRQRR